MTNPLHEEPANEIRMNPPQVTPLSFQMISSGKTEVTIEHEGQLYRLRVTKNGKLLLNK